MVTYKGDTRHGISYYTSTLYCHACDGTDGGLHTFGGFSIVVHWVYNPGLFQDLSQGGHMLLNFLWGQIESTNNVEQNAHVQCIGYY